LVLELATIWNILLTVIVAPIAWYIKSQSDELKRVQILLNKTENNMYTRMTIKMTSIN
tara:strand:+ start:2540 stop:2713 length:174 start_codon:yes stop_codon:yes gene_type:complete